MTSCPDWRRLDPAELAAALAEIAKSLESAASLLERPGTLDLEDLERRLTVLDEKLQATLTNHAPEELMLRIRRELDGQLAAYRRKMKAEQLALVQQMPGAGLCREPLARRLSSGREPRPHR